MKTKTDNQFASLYEDISLYDIPEAKKNEPPLFEGKNLKKILILVAGELPPEEREQLMKILSALKLVPDDVALVKMVGENFPSFAFLKSTVNFEKLIVFGIAPAKIGMNISVTAYKVLSIQNARFIFSHSLKSLLTDTLKKDALWKALQKMFVLRNV